MRAALRELETQVKRIREPQVAQVAQWRTKAEVALASRQAERGTYSHRTLARISTRRSNSSGNIK